MLISAVLLVISISFFTFSYSMQGLNKSIINTPVELLYDDVNFMSENPKIVRAGVKVKLENYYKETLPKYCKDYSTQYYFYNSNDESLCTSNFCDGVEVTIDASLSLGYKYHRVMYYELRRGVHNG